MYIAIFLGPSTTCINILMHLCINQSHVLAHEDLTIWHPLYYPYDWSVFFSYTFILRLFVCIQFLLYVYNSRINNIIYKR